MAEIVETSERAKGMVAYSVAESIGDSAAALREYARNAILHDPVRRKVNQQADL